MNKVVESMERWMEVFTMNHNTCSIINQEERGPLCIEKAQTSIQDLQEHTEPPMLVEEEEDKQSEPPSPPNLASLEEYSQWDEGNLFLLCFASFYFLK